MKFQRWRFRDNVFKLGFCGVLLSLALCCIGFLAPAWQNSGGLWIHNSPPHPVPGWVQAVRILVTASVVALCVTILLEVYQDICSKIPPGSESYLVEITSALAGFFGLTAVILFAVQAHVSYPPGQGPFGPCSKRLFWAWGLYLVGSLTAVLSAAILAYSRARNQGRSRRRMEVVAFRKEAPVGLNPYFVSRCGPAVNIVPPTQELDSHV